MPGKSNDKIVRAMHEFAATLGPGQEFSPKDAVRWFDAHYSKIRPGTVALHARSMVANDPEWRRGWRKNWRAARQGKGWDLFFKVDNDNSRLRLWDEATDGPAQYPEPRDSDAPDDEAPDEDEEQDEDERAPGETAEEFAREHDLRDYLAKHLEALEPGLRLHENGVEHPVDGGFIDILALDKDGNPVVIELKVSKGHKRVVGQLAYYLAWVKEKRAEGRPVRGFIVAGAITDKVRLAASLLPDVSLFEYSIAFSVRRVEG